ncbi:hypothetical protein [Burkholderia oklahomensis]|uniref:hypothetical protein n=1 Tax=Burkholderia oklahomensis TaxID=342113 RepID=UPI0005722309|nr:hypothetical protein [Burkholderia oklahomensis]AJX32474.1 hypothetical protein BG90_108 [Burkholderia oklahomensis C6786]AOI46329.1 hypothetical protein WI23_11380 [Burkholderia oklahomensis C6786]KUY52852.1 hypothetical protein WI23_23945 [Burkholderia oklahomensis C6786]MBI0361076.1 hypothetical protein [Burkholderia oklahomensis]
MRDDLHTTMALRPHWRKAVRAVERPDQGEAVLEIHRASCREWEDGVRPAWFAELVHKVEEARSSLFSVESVLAVVDSFEQSAWSSLERNVCEVARQVAYGGPVDRLEGVVRATVISDCARQGIEHCALSVADQFNEGQSNQLRRAMTKLAADIDFTSKPAPRTKKKLDTDQILDLSLDMRV